MRSKDVEKYVADFVKATVQSNSKSLQVYYNNAISPETYGDLFYVLMLARYLAFSGFQLSFTILDYSRAERWNYLTITEQDTFVSDQISLARYLLPTDVKIELVNGHTRVNSDQSEESGNRIGDVLLPNGSAFFEAAPYFLHCLIAKYEWGVPVDFLLSEPTRKDVAPHIAWHIRRGSYDRRRDSSETSIQNDFHQLKELFPHHAIKLFSDTVGLEHAFSALSGSPEIKALWKDEVRVIPQSAKGFIDAIPEVLSADFYFQRNAGGLGIIPIFSSMPYVQLCPDSTNFYGKRGDSLVPWATKSQIFHQVWGDIESFPLRRFIQPQ